MLRAGDRRSAGNDTGTRAFRGRSHRSGRCVERFGCQAPGMFPRRPLSKVWGTGQSLGQVPVTIHVSVRSSRLRGVPPVFVGLPPVFVGSSGLRGVPVPAMPPAPPASLAPLPVDPPSRRRPQPARAAAGRAGPSASFARDASAAGPPRPSAPSAAGPRVPCPFRHPAWRVLGRPSPATRHQPGPPRPSAVRRLGLRRPGRARRVACRPPSRPAPAGPGPQPLSRRAATG